MEKEMKNDKMPVSCHEHHNITYLEKLPDKKLEIK
jgi:hypothetical protein